MLYALVASSCMWLALWACTSVAAVIAYVVRATLHWCVIGRWVLLVGDRTKEALISFVETLVPSAGKPHYYVRYLPTSCNCQLSIHTILSLFHLSNNKLVVLLKASAVD